MRVLHVLIIVLAGYGQLQAQEFKADVSYKYLYARQWDKAIQTYNFSRPFVTEKQPLLIHGISTGASYLFKSATVLKHGLNLSYAYHRSSAQSNDFKNTLNLHGINLGYLLHYTNTEKLKNFYGDLIISATTTGLFRKLNEQPFVVDDQQSRAFGIGGDICVKAGYLWKTKTSVAFSPLLALAYSPYFYSPNTEAVINQTKGLVGKNWTGILSVQIGIGIHFLKQSNKS